MPELHHVLPELLVESFHTEVYNKFLLVTMLQWHWKLLLILMLCDTYHKWEQHQMTAQVDSPTDEVMFTAALEWDFYCMFLIVTLGENYRSSIQSGKFNSSVSLVQ